MKRYKAHIECNDEGFFTVYVPNDDFPFGWFGEGFSVEEAKRDFLDGFAGMAKEHFDRTGVMVEADFDFVYDASAFLQHFKGMLTLSGMSKITGINKSQLSQYVCGRRHPSPKTEEKIKASVKKFAEELSRAML